MTDTRRHKLQVWLPPVLVIIGIAAAFDAINYGTIIYGDEGYMALCVRHYSESPLGMLTFWIGHLWEGLFGERILALRALAALGILGAVGTASIYLYRRTRNPLLASATFLAMMVAGRISEFHLYNWDSGTYFFDSIALVTLLSYLRKPRAWKAAVAGAVVMCMTLGRVPLAIFIFVAAGVIIVRREHVAANLSVMLGTAAVMFLVLTTLMIGSPVAYFAAFSPQNIVSGHAPTDIDDWWWRLTNIGNNQPKWWIPATLCCLLPLLLMKRRLRLWGIIGLVLTTLLALVLMSRYLGYFRFAWSCLGWAFPLLLGPLCLCGVWNRRHPAERIATPRAALWLCGLFPLLVALGSDSFFERMCVVFSIPCIIAEIWPKLPGGCRSYLRYYLLTVIIVMGSMLAGRTFRKIQRNPVAAASYLAPYRGLHIPAQHAISLEAAWQAHADLRARRMRYVDLGERYILQLLFGDDYGTSIHYFAVEEDMPALIRSIDRADAVAFYSYVNDSVKPLLIEKGFTVSRNTGLFTLYVRAGR